MFWLVFYNGFGSPEVECSFSTELMLMDYVEHSSLVAGRIYMYTVFTPDRTVVSLKDFLENEKEY